MVPVTAVMCDEGRADCLSHQTSGTAVIAHQPAPSAGRNPMPFSGNSDGDGACPGNDSDCLRVAGGVGKQVSIIDHANREGRCLCDGILEGVTLFLGVASVGSDCEGCNFTADVSVYQVQQDARFCGEAFASP